MTSSLPIGFAVSKTVASDVAICVQ
jgi:hypothetical protein